MRPDDVPLRRLAELYGVVVAPEEARRFYRRYAWIRIGTIWGITLCALAVILVVRFA